MVGKVQKVGVHYCSATALAGSSVKTYRVGWPEGPLSAEEMVKTHSLSRINLGFGGIVGHRNLYCLQERDFEIPLSVKLYLTEYHPELETVRA